MLQHDDAVLNCVFSPDGTMLATGSKDRTLRVWDVATEQEIIRFPSQKYWVWAVGFSPDGKLLASGSGVWNQKDVPGEVKVWDIPTGRVVAILEGHSGGVFSVNFAPDGKELITASADQTVKLWDIASGCELTTIPLGPVERGWRYCAELSPDGHTLFSVSESTYNDPITLWEFPSGKILHSFASDLRCAAFSSDGRALATVGPRGIQLWDMVHWKGPAPATLSAKSEKSNDADGPDANTFLPGVFVLTANGLPQAVLTQPCDSGAPITSKCSR